MNNDCPKCKEGRLMSLPSIHRKMCSSCRSYFKWTLKDGQKSILLKNYVGGRDDHDNQQLPEL